MSWRGLVSFTLRLLYPSCKFPLPAQNGVDERGGGPQRPNACDENDVEIVPVIETSRREDVWGIEV
jgi:hypothetical protein